MTQTSTRSVPTTFHDVLYQQAEHRPNKPACRFLNDQGEPQVTLTYQMLLEHALGIASRLAKHQNQRVLLLLPPGADYVTAFLGCLLAGAVAVPLYPPRKNASMDRIRSVVNNCSATAAVVHRALYEESTLHTTGIHDWIFPDDHETDASPPEINPHAESLAFLQYTSGSVGTPKGVAVSHANILSNLETIAHFSQQNSNSYGVSWLPPYHDMGLIGGILFPLYSGFTVDLISPQTFLRSPIKWLKFLSQTKATVSVAPNFALDLCVEHAKKASLEHLDLSAWEVCFVGAEPVRGHTLQRFYNTFKPYGFRYETFLPCYGMAETTLLATCDSRNTKPTTLALEANAFEQGRVRPAPTGENAYSAVGCGLPANNHQILIADPHTHEPCRPDHIGEIWVSGPSVAQGYWNQPELTNKTFCAQPKEEDQTGPYLRTGDLGFVRNNQLFITGRLHDMMIIRGRNYFPQDIEQCAEQNHEALQPNGSACFLGNNKNNTNLTLVLELRRSHYRTANTNDIVQAIRRAVLGQFQISVDRVVLLKPTRLPRTSSGKVRRKATAQALAKNKLSLIDDWTLSTAKSKTSPKLLTTLNWLRTYAKTRINSQLIDERRSIPPYIVLDFGNHGLLGMEIPETYGGPGFSLGESLKIAEQLGAIDTTLALFVGVNNALGVRPVLKYGSESLKKTWLPVLAAGRELAAFSITEPVAGANPQKIASTARTTGPNQWQLSGTKLWSGNAAWAGLIHIFAHETDETGKRCGISAFAMPQDTPGMHMGPESLTMGVRGMVQNSVHLNNAPIHADYQLHTSGRGLEVAQDAMVRGRLGIGAIAIGAMKRCAQLMVHYASKREISQGTLLENPVSRTRLSNLTAAITASEALVYRMAALLETGQDIPHDLFSSCKILIPELAWQAVDQLIQMLGGRGYEEPNIASRLMRDIRLLRIFEGPTETLCAYVGAKVCNGDQTLHNFLTNTWEKPHIAQELGTAIHTLDAVYQHSNAQHHACGELAAWASLWAAIPLDTPEQIRATRWAKSQFNTCFEHAQKNEPSLSSQNIESIVQGYTEDLGTWEQTAPGANRNLDPLLETSDTPQTESSGIPTAIPGAPQSHPQAGPTDPRTRELTNWIIDQLGQMLHIDSAQLHPASELIDLGVDSILAVQIIDVIETHLHIEISPSIIWSFPTLHALADELIRLQDADLQPPLQADQNQEQTPGEDIVELLEKEINLNRQMRQEE